METGWICVCGRTNRAFSCPRCGRQRPTDAAEVPVASAGPPGTTRQHQKPWWELSEGPPAPAPAETSETNEPVASDTVSVRATVAEAPPVAAEPEPTPTPEPEPLPEVDHGATSIDARRRETGDDYADPVDAMDANATRAEAPMARLVAPPSAAPAGGPQPLPPTRTYSPPSLPPSSRPRLPGWGEDLAFALGTPLTMAGSLMIGLSGVFGAGVTVISGFPFGLPMAFCLVVFYLNYLNTYFVKTLEASSVGRTELPDSPNSQEMTGRLFQFVCIGFGSYLPALSVVVLSRFGPDLGGVVYGSLFFVAHVLGTFLYPMALLLTTLMTNPALAFNYPALVASVAKTFPSYVLVFLFCLVVTNVTMGAAFTLMLVLGVVGMGGLLGTMLVAASLAYSGMATALLLGRYYRREARTLDWFPGSGYSDLPDASSPRGPAPVVPRTATNSFSFGGATTAGLAPVPYQPTNVIHTAPVEGLSLRERVDQQLSEIASSRTRDWICVVLGLAITFFATKVEMKHWTARQIIDDEIMRGPGDIRETIPRMIEAKCGVKILPEEMQFLAVTEAGMRDGSVECNVTIRSDSSGFYDQGARVVRITPTRPVIFGFDKEPTKANLWKLEKWRQPSRLTIIFLGLALVVVCGVRRGTASD